MATKEADIEEVYERIKEIEESKEDTAHKIPVAPKTWFALSLAVIAIATIFKYIEFMTGAILAVSIILIMRFIFGEDSFGREYTEQELATALYKKLRYKQTHPLGNFYQIEPFIIIQVERVGRRVRIKGVPQERIFGVSFYNPRTRQKKWFRYAVDLKTADITGCRELPAGFIDLEDWDIKVIESERIRDEKRYNRSLGVKPKRV